MSTARPESTDDATAVGSTQLAGTSTNAGFEHIVSALLAETALEKVSDMLSSPDGDRIRRSRNANRDTALTQGVGSTRRRPGMDMPGSSTASSFVGTADQSVSPL